MASAVSETFHHWANASKRDGRRSDRRVYFRGAKFFSYGDHYVAGYRLPEGMLSTSRTDSTPSRFPAVLVNAKRYSVSTSSHVSALRSAARHIVQFWVPDLTSLVYYWPENPARLAAYLDENPHARAAIARHAVEWIRELEPDAGRVLFELAGDKPARAEKRYQDEREKARKADEKAAADHARREHANRLNRAKIAAAMTDGEALEWAQDTGPYGRSDTDSIIERLKSAGAELRRVQIAANKEKRGYVKTVQRLRELQKLIKARREHLEKNRDLIALRARVRYAVTAIRDMVTPVQPEAVHPSVVRAGRDGAAFLAGLCLVRPATRAKLSRLASMASAALEMQARHDHRERMAKQAAAIAAWQAGESNARPYGATDEKGGALLRAVNVQRDESGAITGGTLETSQGASVPLIHAIKAFRFVKLCRDAGRTWNRNGHSIRVGHYTLDSITPAGDFKAGCHSINWGQIERLARVLGVMDLPADDSALINTHAHA